MTERHTMRISDTRTGEETDCVRVQGRRVTRTCLHITVNRQLRALA